MIKYLCLLAFLNLSCQLVIDKVGGNFDNPPRPLSQPAKDFVFSALKDLNGDIHDIHVHIIGVGSGGTGAYVHPDSLNWIHFFKWIKTRIYMSASGLKSLEKGDQKYIKRLVQLIRGIGRPYKAHILGFDKYYNLDGQAHEDLTDIYVPNDYIYKLSQEYPDIFVPVISIHPYRKDAVKRLRFWAEKGVRWVKWLPNVMGMDPSHEKLRPYYQVMKEYNMTLLTHGGEEQAAKGAQMQYLGNPLLLRYPLDQGVRVVVAHCASLGEGVDLDAKNKKKLLNLKLFFRLMEDKKYEGLLYGGLSATPFVNRLGEPLSLLLKQRDLHSRLLYASDYPLPGMNILIPLKRMAKKGYIKKEHVSLLNEIYSHNPLLFNLVVQRKLKHPKTGEGFKKEAFNYPL